MGSGCGGDAAGSPGVLRRKVSGRFDALVAARCTTRARTRIGGTSWERCFCRLSRGSGAMRTSRRAGDRVNPSRMSKVASEILFGRPGADRGGGRHIVAARPSRRHGAAAAEPWVSTADDQASLRPPGGGGCELQPEEAGPSHAYHAFLMATRLVLRAVIAQRPRPRASGGSTGRARDKDWGSQHGVARGRVSVQAAPDEGSAPVAERLMARDEWEDAGQWSGIEASFACRAGAGRVAWLCCAVACRG